jgi:hypothetical protein
MLCSPLLRGGASAMNSLRVLVPVILLALFAACSSSGGTTVHSPASTVAATTTLTTSVRPSPAPADPLGGAAGQTAPAAALTPVATATSTAPPTAAPTVQPAPTGVTFVSVQGGSPGSYAAVSVLTAAEAPCSISYANPAGTNTPAQGLFDQRASRSGAASWNWKIDDNTGLGVGRVIVTCGGASATTPIQIG